MLQWDIIQVTLTHEENGVCIVLEAGSHNSCEIPKEVILSKFDCYKTEKGMGPKPVVENELTSSLVGKLEKAKCWGRNFQLLKDQQGTAMSDSHEP